MKLPEIIFNFGLCYVVLLSNGIRAEASIPRCQNCQSHTVMMPEQEDQPYRTSFHFQPPRNWMNDPNGPMWYKGYYHLFYQFTNRTEFGDGDSLMWGHAVSHDLIDWIHLDTALYPTEPYDSFSCWSGSATILPGDQPAILYTGLDANRTQLQNLAVPKDPSDPFLQEWTKAPQNPLMTPPTGVDSHNFRDPTTAWRSPDGKWNVIVGSYLNDQGMAILYRSEDFVHWTKYDHPLHSSEGTGMWECPDFYPVSINSTNGLDTSVLNPDVRHVLKASLKSHDYYVIGNYVPQMGKFIPDTDFITSSMGLRYDNGKFYASKTFFDGLKNRRILWGWVNESDTTADDHKKGWAGVQSIPRQIWLDKSGKQLMQWPVEEIKKLRSEHITVLDMVLESGSVFEVQGISASQADIEIMFELPELAEAEFLDPIQVDPQQICFDANASVQGKFGPFGLLALATKNLTEQTAVFFRIYKGQKGHIVLMCSDQSRSSLKDNIDKTTYGAFVDIDPQHEKISLRSLIDHSIVESFGGEGKTCITSRVYPELAVEKEAHIFLFNNGTGSLTISSLNAWSMNKAQFKYKAPSILEV